jgi:glutamine amidotransferase
MIVIVDYGMGNLRSIANAFDKIQVPASISSDPLDIARADKLVLPGVGAFDEGMRNLRARGLAAALEERLLGSRTPALGICLGLQLLTRRSDEGSAAGLGWLGADTVGFARTAPSGSLKVPHMGWNTAITCADNPLFAGLPPECAFYFAHSFFVHCDDPAMVVARSSYGVEFAAAIQKGNLFGTQFHPEKSLAAGLRLLLNFAQLV